MSEEDKVHTHTQKVFVSTAHADSAVADRLHKVLTENGYDVYPKTTCAGNSISEWHREQIRGSDTVLLLVPRPDTVNSQLFSDLAEALEAQKTIIPVLVDARSRTPAVLQSRQAVKLVNEEDWENRLLTIVDSIEKKPPNPVDANAELQRIRTHENTLMSEFRTSLETLDNTRRKDADILLEASKFSSTIASGLIVGTVLGFGPLVGIAAAGLASYAVKSALRRRRRRGDVAHRKAEGQGGPDLTGSRVTDGE
ncbi:MULTISPECIES: toll/interleukin-1 receptor domain-containing protein [Actinosynnema]|uniref:toll/interleukin-1 receptor domain-containing protein n=1 Tax=Actinosynnema TaxID=40566 RepID=UPI0020A24042|nr:toll/interleukin-1 receptor domain-containing protein [Actinosynnema pretiosum]MCP2092471.1 TIR domain-containing protein [Actinosynnema pretiosum]